MKIKLLAFVVLCVVALDVDASMAVIAGTNNGVNDLHTPVLLNDTITETHSQPNNSPQDLKFRTNNSVIDDEVNPFDSLILVNKRLDSIQQAQLKPLEKNVAQMPIAKLTLLDSLMYEANPLFIDLVFENLTLNFNWNLEPDFLQLYYGRKPTTLLQNAYQPIKSQNNSEIVLSLRKKAKTSISNTAAELYAFNFDELPDPDLNKSKLIEEQDIKKMQLVVDDATNLSDKRKLVLAKLKYNPWSRRAMAMMQFSESVVSKKWYQGGSNNVAVLALMSGAINYDDKKYVQWETLGEWRMGFNSLESDVPGRVLQTNDDILKINSKLGVKAGGNWFYSSYFDFSTQFFNSYKGVNSLDKKTAFLTPVRLNAGVGLDFKYRKLISFLVSPIAYKYIYIHVTDKVDPNQFGIPKGSDHMRSIGSSFKAMSTFTIMKDIAVDSRLNFYTDYKKVEVDLEMVANYTINRFMSIRLSYNPRYDNTVIEEAGSKAKLQYKQFMSIGFAHKFK